MEVGPGQYILLDTARSKPTCANLKIVLQERKQAFERALIAAD
jgi:hypothetical protein